jgi:AraC family transcriptional regulator
VSSLVQFNSQATKAPVLDQTGFGPLYSSRGTRWGGLVVEKTRRLTADCPHSFVASEPLAGCILFKTEVRWTARGARHSYSFRPGVGVFITEGYRIDELTFTASHYEAIRVLLECEKIAELMQDDVRSTRVDFLEHVISSDEQMVGMLHAMFVEAQAGSPAGDLFSQSISVALLAHLYARYDRTSAARRLEGRLSLRQDEIVRRHVREHIGDSLSIAQLASLLQLSPAYFCKAFSRTHGITPHRFVLNQRIVIAVEKLRQPSAPPLAELARALGFADEPHFSNVFRKIVGCPPSEFRNRVR